VIHAAMGGHLDAPLNAAGEVVLDQEGKTLMRVVQLRLLHQWAAELPRRSARRR